MVIDARHMFGCTHTFVSVTEGPRLLFACASCGYRTELLSLERRPRQSPALDGRQATTAGRLATPAGAVVPLRSPLRGPAARSSRASAAARRRV